MSINISAASNVLSAAAVMLISPLLCKTERKEGIFSASLGIILYRIVKSIIVECGWEFAAAAGVRTGILLEAASMCCGLVLFSEMGKAIQKQGYNTNNLPASAVIMLCVGKGLLVDSRLVPSSVEFIIGHAAESALMATSVCIAGNQGEAPDAKTITAFAVVCSAGSFAVELLLWRTACAAPSAAAPFLIMLSCCELMCVFAGGMKNSPAISPFGFAAGLLLSYGFDCLTG